MLFLTFQNDGLFLKFSQADNAETGLPHRFCGAHNTEGAICPNCRKPLLRFFVFDKADARLRLSGLPFRMLPLFFCWTCPLAQSNFYYQLTGENAIRILQYGAGETESDFPYQDYPVSFPLGHVALTPISPDIQQAIHDHNANEELVVEFGHSEVKEPQHQFGGEPLLVQKNPDATMRCFVCKTPMPFLASVGDRCLDERGFTGNPYVQALYYYCAKCCVIGTFQQTD